MVTLFRVEDVEGIGPYRKNAADMGLTVGETSQHPFPGYEGLLPISRMERFAFRSLSLLIGWFGPDRTVLEDLGYRIVQIEVRDALVRDGQTGLQSVFYDFDWPREILDFEYVFGVR